MDFHFASMHVGEQQDAGTRSVSADAKLLDVLKVAQKADTSFLFVHDDQNNPIGILATDDVVRRVTCPTPNETQRWMDMTVEAMLAGRLNVSTDVVNHAARADTLPPVTQVSQNGQLLGMMTDNDVLVSWKTVKSTLAASQGDGVTGLPNRATFDYHLDAECNRAAREGSPIAVLLVDLDHFKQINDQHGHSAGDSALRVISTAIRRSLRSYDMVARFGGDELAVICSGCRLNEVDIVMRRIRDTVMGLSDNPEISGPIPSISVGAAVAFDTQSHSIRKQLIDKADECLYAAKRVGRNCGFKNEMHVTAPSEPVYVPDDYSDTKRIESILDGATALC
ncbi:MAG: diguanylate cyclase [Fuerstiella sp.]